MHRGRAMTKRGGRAGVNAVRLGIPYKGTPKGDLAGIVSFNLLNDLMNLCLTISAIAFIRNSCLTAERGGVVLS